MGEIFGSVWWLLVTLGVLITLHEYGHFWVARKLGVKVLRFSVGFGKPLWSRRGQDGTEYTIAAIPLGGYVKMLDEREESVPVADRQYSFNQKTPLARMAIAFAGPLANIIFAIIAFWFMLVIGKPDFLPMIDTPVGIAQQAGLQAGDQFLSIDGQAVETWTEARIALVDAILTRRDTPVTVQDEQLVERRVLLPLSQIPVADSEVQAIEKLGVKPWYPVPEARVAEVTWGGSADQAGLKEGDLVLAINGVSVADFSAFRQLIQDEATKSPELILQINRDQQVQEVAVKAEQKGVTANGKPVFILGIAPPSTHNTKRQLGAFAAIPAAFVETWHMTVTSLRFLKFMVTGQASLNNVSGVIGIAQVANFSAGEGLAWFIWFLATMSLSIAILNLLPIPILDGGHIVCHAIEWITGKPLNEKVLGVSQYVGLVLLFSLMGLAFYNDILRLIS